MLSHGDETETRLMERKAAQRARQRHLDHLTTLQKVKEEVHKTQTDRGVMAGQLEEAKNRIMMLGIQNQYLRNCLEQQKNHNDAQDEQQEKLRSQKETIFQMRRYVSNIRASMKSVVNQLLVARGQKSSEAEVEDIMRQIAPPVESVVVCAPVDNTCVPPTPLNVKTRVKKGFKLATQQQAVKRYSEDEISCCVKKALKQCTRKICARLSAKNDNLVQDVQRVLSEQANCVTSDAFLEVLHSMHLQGFSSRDAVVLSQACCHPIIPDAVECAKLLEFLQEHAGAAKISLKSL